MAFSTASTHLKQKTFRENTLLQVYLSVFFICWVITYIQTPDRANWFTENALTVLVLLLLVRGYRKFVFSDLSYTLFFVYALLHIYGAEYTYAENPLGYRIQEWLGQERNHYDRIVHFSFGFLMTYPMRDYFMNRLEWPSWVCWVLPVEITISFSGMYEIIEWLVADIFFPAEGIAYLGTQGDVWDAQKDMALAGGGAILIMLLLAGAKSLYRRT